jgi:ATP-dependent helicase/nuclease subunit B
VAEPNLFALPPGVDFPAALVAGLIERMDRQPPEAMARVQLYLNTSRMLRRVRSEFDRHGARLLPQLRLVSALGLAPDPGVPAAVSSLRRRLELTQLVAEFVGRQPDFSPGAGAFELAQSLADLLAEMQIEGVAPAALERLDVAEHARHWQRSLQFVQIVARYFAEESPPDPEARLRKTIEALAMRWAAMPPRDPVIVAGSTGSRGATSLLIQTVARLDNGAVVLPGFDFEMPEFGWNSLDSGEFPCEDHPQFRFLSLTRALNVTPAHVRPWHARKPPSQARNRLVSLALRPAPITDQWMRDGKTLTDLPEAAEGMTLIEAANPRTEAQCIALILRHAAEDGTRAALVTPDRLLARRVTAALDRWGIIPDDSAGQPLSLSPPGRFLRHVAGLIGTKITTEALFVLLKHPITATGGGTRGPHLLFTRDLELHLRRHGPAFPDADALLAWANRRTEPERIAWARWLGAAITGLEMYREAPLSACIETHISLAETLSSGPFGSVAASGLWQKEAGKEAAHVIDELRREAAHGGSFAPADYTALITRLLQAGSVRQTEASHPQIKILGTLEARAQGADLVILGGMNEGVWPDMPPPDPWLSRKMRLDSGLLLPERRIGLAAHDFQQAIAAQRVVITRALRDTDAENVPSRWLNRLKNLLNGLPDVGGPEALANMRARGQSWIQTAVSLDIPRLSLAPATRPSPRPPSSVRIRELPVTAIKTLIRDPYAIYAKRILRLRPLDPLRRAPDAKMRGNVLHKIIEDFVKERPECEAQSAAQERLIQTAERVLDAEVPWPTERRLWLARISRLSAAFVVAEADRSLRGVPVILEEKGSISLPNVAFTLTATPDRIDLLNDGSTHIFDYKSTTLPSAEVMKAYDKQLLLEAVMVEQGGFSALGPRAVSGYSYVRLGGEGGERTMVYDADLVSETWTKTKVLISKYLEEKTGFTSRRAVQLSSERGEFDHLARYGEWDITDPPMPEDVG